MQRLLLTVAGWLGSAVIGSGIAVYFGRTFFQGWLEAKFKKQLQETAHEQTKETERLKSELNQEIEHLKARISAQADRRLRMHQYEFETLPRLWELIDKAYTAVAQAVIQFDISPDLTSASDERLKAFAVSRSYTSDETEALLAAKDKNKAVSNIGNVRKQNEAQKDVWKLRRYNFRNRIFWPPELSVEIEQILNEMTEALVLSNTSMRGDAQQIDRWAKVASIFTDGNRARLQRVQTMIKDRLNLNLIAPNASG